MSWMLKRLKRQFLQRLIDADLVSHYGEEKEKNK